MSSVDTRVVEMRFDNGKFEAGVQNTLKSLNELDHSLDGIQKNDGVEVFASVMKDGFNNASRSVRDFANDFKQQKNVIVQSYTVIGRIINKLKDNVANTFIKMGKELTLAPIDDGFKEYELKMDSIRTIMAGSGESLSVVKKALEELNKYADDTIYSFSDMTQNIGKFTNAGVKLDKSVAAIKGVANWAAISGANANEASRAMYNLAQSLSAGYVKLIDWKSIENANMATVSFKNQLLETAEAMGVLTKQQDGMYKTKKGHLISATKNFNEYLSDQWLTADVLIKVLGDYADETTEIGKAATEAATKVRTFSKMMDTLKEAAASGWAESFEHIWGDYDQATRLFTGLTDRISSIIDGFGKFRNKVLEEWDHMGGRLFLKQTLFTFLDSVKEVGDQIGEAFLTAFGINKEMPIDDLAFKLVHFTKQVRDGMQSLSDVLHAESFVKGKTNLELIGDVLGKVLKVLVPVVGAVAAFQATKGVIGLIGGIGRSLFGLVKGPIKMLSVLPALIPSGGALVGILSLLVPLAGMFLFTSTASAEGIEEESKQASTLTATLKDLSKRYTDTKERLKSWYNTLTQNEHVKKSLDTISERFTNFKTNLLSGTYFTKAKNDLKTWFDGVKQTPEVAKLIDNLSGSYGKFRQYLSSDEFKEKTAQWLDWLIERFDSLKGLIGSAKTWLGDRFSSVIQSVSGAINKGMNAEGKFSFSEFISNLGFDYDFTPIFDWAATARDSILDAIFSIFSSSAKADEISEPSQITGGGTAIETLTDQLTESGTLTDQAANGLKTAWESVKKIFASIGETLSSDEMFDKIETGVKRISDLVVTAMPGLTALVSLFWSFRIGGNLNGAAKGLRKTAQEFVGIGDLFKEGLGGLFKSISQGNTNLFNALTVGGTKVTDGISGYFEGLREATKKKDTFATAVLKIAGALALLAGALWVLSKIEPSSLDRCLITLGILAAGLATVSILLSKVKSTGAMTMAGIATGLILLIIPMKMLLAMSTAELAEGLIKIGLVMLVVGGLAQLFRDTEGTRIRSGAVASFAFGLTLLLIPLNIIANMDTGKLVKGIVGLGAVMLELGLFMQAMRTGTTFKGGNMKESKFQTGALISLAVGLTMLMIPLKILAGMSITELVKGIGSLGIILAELGLAMQAFRTSGNTNFKVGSIVVMAIGLSMLMIPLSIMGKMKLGSLVKGVVGLGAVMLALVMAMNAMRGIKISESVSFVIIAGGLTALIVAMAAFSTLGWDGVTKAVAGVGALGVLFAALALFSKANPLSLAKNLLSLVGVVAVIIAVLTAIDALDQHFAGGAIFEAVNGMVGRLGEAIGSFIGGIGVGASADLVTIGSNFETFATSVGSVTTDQLTAADTLMNIILKLGAADVLTAASNMMNTMPTALEAIGQLFGVEIEANNETSTDRLVDFAKTMVKYSKIVRDVDVGAVTSSHAAADMLMDLASSAPKGNGLISILEGDTNWDNLKTGLPKFATAMKAYAAALKEGGSFDADNTIIKRSKDAAKILMALYSSGEEIKNQGSFFESFTGVTNWSQMVTDLPKFATAMHDFAAEMVKDEAMSDTDITKVITNSKQAADILMALYSSGEQIKNEGGFFESFTGVTNWKKMATDLPEFAKGIAGYSKAIVEGGFDANAVGSTEHIAQLLVDLENKLPNSNGLWQMLFGEKSWTSVAEGLADFGQEITKFSKRTAMIDNVGIQKGITAADDLVTIATKLRGDENLGIFSFLVDNTNNFSTFSTSLDTLGDALVTFSEKTSDIQVTTFATVVNLMTELLKFSELLFDGYGALDAGATMAAFISTLDSSDSFNAMTGRGSLAGIAEKISAGISNGFKGAFDGQSLGYFVNVGIANGINSGAWMPTIAAAALALKVRNAFANVLKIASPSRVFTDFGQYCSMGLAQGIEKTSDLPAGAAADMAMETLSNTQSMLAELSMQLAQGIDPTIRIRPVLDTSQLASGISTVNGMLGGQTYGIGIRSRDLASNAAAGQPSSASMASALNAVNSRINELSDAISNMNIVLDSGALVGGIQAKMDQSLGRVTRLKVRGV